ncbi:MAG TPA: heavy metal-binding domain-containing protein, partial [Pyrinomonadaceae bacterium]|nr:heavy metal-binding domain-containing protein [Pyrinomonadaceae bacterium]
NITAWTNLCELTRREAFEIMVQHATELNANAIIGARYDATELGTGITEVLAYGTAVVVESNDATGIYNS